MAITIASNITSLQAQRQLGRATSTLSEVSARLSSGQRINKACDDAAGIAIAEGLRTDSRLFAQAIRNVNDGLSCLSIADAALEQLSAIVMRQMELAQQSANGVLGFKQRKALDSEANELTEEFNRIIDSTAFNGQRLLSTAGFNISLQVGIEGTSSGLIDISLGSELSRAVGDGTFTYGASYAGNGNWTLVTADFNNDGILDIVSDTRGLTPDLGTIFLGNGDGTFSIGQSFETGGTSSSDAYHPLIAADLNSDGNLDLIRTNHADSTISVLLGNGDGSFGSLTTFSTLDKRLSLAIADFNSDGTVDILTGSHGQYIELYIGNGDGTFQAATTYQFLSGGFSYDMRAADLDGDGILDLAMLKSTTTGLTLWKGDGSGNFTSMGSYSQGGYTDLELVDFNHDGNLDIVTAGHTYNYISVYMNQGAGQFAEGVKYETTVNAYRISSGDFNNDGIPDIQTSYGELFFGNRDGTLSRQSRTSFYSYAKAVGDFNSDGILDFCDPNTGYFNVYFGDSRDSTYESYQDLFTQGSSSSALDSLRGTLERITAERGQIGAYQGRLESALKTLESSRLNSTAAASRIVDADLAIESASLVKARILQQAASAVLAQANLQSSVALEFFK